MSAPTDVVIAGTKPFALALFAPVTERAGSRPRIAPEPATALTLCATSSGVLVVEYEPRWLPALTQLRQSRPGLRVVAALSRGQEGAAGSLAPLSIETVAWDGRAVSVLPAIERAIGGARDAAPAVAPPPTAPPVVAPPTAHPTAAAPPVVSPAPASPAVAAPTAVAPPVGSSPVVPARVLVAPALRAAAAAAAAAPPIAPPPPPEPQPLDLFSDLGARAATPVPVKPPSLNPPAPASREAAPPPAARAGDAHWPASGPSAAEAEQALRAALAAGSDGTPLGAVADRTASGLSALERQAFGEGALPVDAGLIRRVAVLRLRVAVALATRPPKGTATDDAAVSELLSEIDQLLVSVKALVDGASPETKLALEGIRNALVSEAVDFSEACHQVGTAEVPLPPSPGRVTGARVLSVHAGVDVEDQPEEQRRRVMPVVVLVVVLLLGAGYHAWNYYATPAPQPPASFEGAPAGTMALRTGNNYFLKTLPGKSVSPADLEAYRQREAKRGNRVRELSPGTWIIEPAHAGAGGKP